MPSALTTRKELTAYGCMQQVDGMSENACMRKGPMGILHLVQWW